MIKLIVLDFDGVVVDSLNAYKDCYRKTLEALGVYLDPTEMSKRIKAYWGKGYKLQLAPLLQEHPQFLPKAIEIYEGYRHSDTFRNQVSLIKGVTQALQELHKSYAIAVATGLRRKYFEEYEHKYQLDCFDAAMTHDDIEDSVHLKPSPFMLEKLCKKFAVTKEEVLYVGDAENDVKMAKAAGVTSVVVLTGDLSHAEAKKLGVKYIIADVTKLEDVLRTF